MRLAKRCARKAFLSFFLCLSFGLNTEASAACVFSLLSHYEFKNSFADSLGVGADLVPVDGAGMDGGSGTLEADSFTFGLNDGLRLSTDLTSSDFRIEMDLRFPPGFTGSYIKLIDFLSLDFDHGFYIHPAGGLTFYPVGATGSTVVPGDSDVTIAIERTGSDVRMLLNGTLEATFDDVSSLSVATKDELYFFIDDQNRSEDATGVVSGIRIFTPVPEPSAFLCLALTGGLTSLRFWSKRRLE